MDKFFLHRIQEENGHFTTGIEVHDTLDTAVLSFWGRMKTGYDHPDHPEMRLVSCKITDGNGEVVESYDLTWNRETDEEAENKYFLHHIRRDGAFDKNIDVLDSFDAAKRGFAEQMEYGYGNQKFPNVDFVSCEITDRSGTVLNPFAETWVKPEAEPETEPETEQE